MKLEINKEKLANLLSKVEKIASKNSTLPALACLLFEFSENLLKIKATNLDISIIVSLKIKNDLDKTILVPASILSSFILNLPKNDSYLNFDFSSNNLKITSQTTDTVIKTQSPEDFPEIKLEKPSKSFKIDSGDLINGLSSVWYSTAVSIIKPEFSSVYVYHDDGDLVFVGTDTFRLAEKKIKVKNSETFESVLIPYKNVSEIIRVLDDLDEQIELCFKDDQLIIISEKITLISRVVEGNFPDYKQIIPKEVKTEIQVLKEDLATVLRVSNIFADKFNQIYFSILPKENIFQINSNSNDVGETKNILKSKITGEDLAISFNSKYITDSFSSIKSDSIDMKFFGNDKPMIIQPSNDKSFMYLVSSIVKR
ncbi:MAG TPA: DNA polymerase III subunit beta [Candidatus Paceibacterota bacterium]|nr:DNA polymerase III subunit beta [Candidatus Paceibacterota bacterium]HMP18987.1 DNA polymerase III subunit beta [Candidatus Paceibacterota bacterium]HMP85238.1 DNA polymerase III subunit beta [Candidatus Paceibacterota bacterium]